MLRHGRFARLGLELLEDRLAPASLPPGFVETPFATNLVNPTAMELSPDGRTFILEQAGTAQVWQGQIRLSFNFFANTNLNSNTVNSAGERGLLGIAFDPNYSANHFLYVYYTVNGTSVHNRISRFTADSTGVQAVPNSELVELDLDTLSAASNHNGGAIHFGADGMLYVGVGDNANGNNAQNLGSLLGKVLRLDVDHLLSASIVPPNNPFVGMAGDRGEIWALGFRNPFTFGVQPGTGTIFINDVGLSSYEEIDVLAKGQNYGWPITEGNFDQNTFPGFTEPLFAYPHPSVNPNAAVTGFVITGGAFYNPTTPMFPSDYTGDYFFADFASGWIRRIDTTTKVVTDFAFNAANPVDIKVASDGNLYYLARGQGTVFRIDYATPGPNLPNGTYGTPSQRFVAALYHDLLKRDVTLTEMNNGAFAGWVNNLNNGLSINQLIVAFENTAEARIVVLNAIYQQYLNRAIEPGGRDGWLQFLAAGGTYEQVEAAVLSSMEFATVHGSDVLDAVYFTALNRHIGSNERNADQAFLQQGGTMQQVATGVVNSPEHHLFQVDGWYQHFLLRTPPTQDVSIWVRLLVGQVRDEQVLADILGDFIGREYYNRVIR